MSRVRWISVPVLVRQPAVVPILCRDDDGGFYDLVIARCLSECVLVFPFADEKDEVDSVG